MEESGTNRAIASKFLRDRADEIEKLRDFGGIGIYRSGVGSIIIYLPAKSDSDVAKEEFEQILNILRS